MTRRPGCGNATTGAETARLEADAPLLCLTALADLHLVAGDNLGRLHSLKVAVRSGSTHDKGRYHALDGGRGSMGKVACR